MILKTEVLTCYTILNKIPRIRNGFLPALPRQGGTCETKLSQILVYSQHFLPHFVTASDEPPPSVGALEHNEPVASRFVTATYVCIVL